MFLPVLGLFLLSLVWGSFAGTANAGFLSFLNKLFAGADDGQSPYNSQNIPLLKAPSALDPKAATGGAVMNLVENSSILPVMGPMGSIADAETYKQDQIATYTVREGDTLSKVADMFAVSVATIYWANDLKRGDLIKTGDTLVILPITGIQHTVKKGDTVKSLAAKYKSNVEEIIAYNDLSADGLLEEGATIIIPDAELAALPQPAARLRGSGGPAFAGYFMRPIAGGRKSQGLHGFNGVDLADSCGTPIYAAAEGTVLVARSQGWNGGYGRYIAISHPNGTQTVYAHLAGVFAWVGQSVGKGLTIGTIGSTGNSTGCHVHFEVRGARQPF